MIASIQGKVIAIGEDHLVIDVGGIGYQVYVPGPVIETLRRGEKTSLFTQLIVRQDALALFGFQGQEDLFLFQQLIKVNGVGPRLALETLSTHSAEIIKRAVLQKQEAIFSQVPGIGKKTAQKILLSLEDRIPFDEEFVVEPEVEGINAEVQEALISLGYSVLEAQAALQNLPNDAPLDLETRLTLALRHFS
jgi:Holliday junction DNA helicase RuvA